MSRIVADLVVQAHAAAAESLAWHYHLLLHDRPRPDWSRIVQAVDFGYAADLDERTSDHQPVGFDHFAISRIFRRRLRPILYGTGLSHHIWEQDEKRQGFYSLFPREPSTASRHTPRRTRASAIVQQLLRDCRDFRQADKANRSSDLNLQVTVPSPLAVAGRLLADPSSEGSQTYAWAALQEWVRERIENEIGGPIDVSFAAISEALTTINNRWKTSKPIIADLVQNGPTLVFVCNVLALRGLAAMRVDAGYLSDAVEWQEEARVSGPEDPDFSEWSATRRMDQRLAALWLGERNASGEFLINPRVVDLPSAGELLNLIEGLPVPFEGGDTVFQGGVRLSSDRSLVATISGDFGTGKTLFGLGLAAALAPLGCRTLFLSCEESAADVTSRLVEAAPRALFRNMPLFRALNPGDFRLDRLNTSKTGEIPALGWFSAGQLSFRDADDSPTDPSSALENLLREASAHAEIFRPFRDDDEDAEVRLPRFARPVIIIDGLHQLFDSPDTWDLLDTSLRSLIDTCRELGAVFLFSFAKEAGGLERLEYLCDLIIEVERGGHSTPSDAPYRIFQLLKARRQPARTGSHLFHIKGDEGFRLKPSVDARVQDLKAQMWWSPTEREAVFLTSGTPRGFRQFGDDMPSHALVVANHSQILVVGHGSSGKAGFGLYVLHRRWFDTDLLVNDKQRRLPIGGPPELPKWKQVLAQSGLPIRSEPQYLETRVLVISFLYQRSYYDDLTKRLAGKRRGKPERQSHERYGPMDALEPMEFAPLPDRLWTDTIELYPGMLSVEDFLAKVEKRLTAAERSGFPYTGVLVDGLHNVFVQFPALEKESAFWGMFYNVLRRRRVTVVTTHTEFDISGKQSRGMAGGTGLSMSYDFAQAERKIAPLLSALVSGADYLFDLSPSPDVGSDAYLLTPRAVLCDNIGGRVYAWDKQKLQLDAAPDLSRVRRLDERPDVAMRLAQNLVRLIG